MSNPLAAEWRIRACAPQCHGCNRPFEDGEKVFSRLLFALGEAGYAREDYCAECAKKLGDEGRNGAISHWTGAWAAPEKKVEPVKKETAESLLRELMEGDDPGKRNVVFILAVMLERRRILVEREVQLQPDGEKIRVYAHRKSGEVFVVPDPGLKLGELAAVQEEVVGMLGGGEKS